MPTGEAEASRGLPLPLHALPGLSSRAVHGQPTHGDTDASPRMQNTGCFNFLHAAL